MKKKTNTQSKDRMIHIRLDDKSHKRLKIMAVQGDTTIQQIVEEMILGSFMKSKSKDVR